MKHKGISFFAVKNIVYIKQENFVNNYKAIGVY